MRPWMLPALLGALAACGRPAPSPTDRAAPVDPVALPAKVAAALAERAAREVDCATSDVRFVCGLAAVPGEAFLAPKEPRSWVGLQFALRPSRTVAGGTRETLRVARLTLGPEGAWVIRLDQTATDASLALPQIRLDAVLASDGERADIPVPDLLAAELGAEPLEPPRPLVQDAEGWRIEGERIGRLWRIPEQQGRPATWIVLEPVDDGQAGAFVSVFPDVPWLVPSPVAAPAPEPTL